MNGEPNHPPDAEPATHDQPAHPAGPVFEWTLPAARKSVRLHAVAWLVVTGTLLGIAVALQPDPTGVNTHTQLGIPPCAMLLTHDIPCPTCGMTTAFVHTVRGHWLVAAGVQPAGFLMALCAAALLLRSVYGLITGKTVLVNWYRVRPHRVMVAAALLIVVAWGYKILAMRGTIG